VTDVHTLDPQQLRTWLQGAAQRDAVAFRSLYDATSPKLFGFALRILIKRELAEEVLQDEFRRDLEQRRQLSKPPGRTDDVDDHHRAQQGFRSAARSDVCRNRRRTV
jgi:hypothetical protein